MNFIDESVLEIKAGDGGSGCISFRREKYIPKGGPDGGNGGKGGSIIFRTDPSLNTLLDFQNKKIIHAKNGLSGQGRNKSGTSAKDLIINKLGEGDMELDIFPKKEEKLIDKIIPETLKINSLESILFKKMLYLYTP